MILFFFFILTSHFTDFTLDVSSQLSQMSEEQLLFFCLFLLIISLRLISKQKGMLAGNFNGKKKKVQAFTRTIFCMYYTDGLEHVLTFITRADLGLLLNRHLLVFQLNIIEPVPKTKCCMQGLHTVQQFIQSGFRKIDLIRIKENMTQLSFHLR